TLPAFRIEPKPAPCVPSIVIALVMVTDPKPPGSRTSISPPSAVLEMAPANVLQGAVRLHGFASSPTPETQVRVACADADAAKAAASNAVVTPAMMDLPARAPRLIRCQHNPAARRKARLPVVTQKTGRHLPPQT